MAFTLGSFNTEGFPKHYITLISDTDVSDYKYQPVALDATQKVVLATSSSTAAALCLGNIAEVELIYDLAGNAKYKVTVELPSPVVQLKYGGAVNEFSPLEINDSSLYIAANASTDKVKAIAITAGASGDVGWGILLPCGILGSNFGLGA